MILLVTVSCSSMPEGLAEEECMKEDGTAIFLGSIFPSNSHIYLNIDEGEYEFEKYFLMKYRGEDNTCLLNYITEKDSFKIYLRVNGKDTSVFLKNENDYRVYIGTNVYREPVISTDFTYWGNW